MLPIGETDTSESPHSQFSPLNCTWTFTLYHSSVVNLGLSDMLGVKLYCPKCMDVYNPKSFRHLHINETYFGTGFPHVLFMVHPEYRPKRPANQFVPRFVLRSYIININTPFLYVRFKWVWVGYNFKEVIVCLFFAGNSNFRLHPVLKALKKRMVKTQFLQRHFCWRVGSKGSYSQ